VQALAVGRRSVSVSELGEREPRRALDAWYEYGVLVFPNHLPDREIGSQADIKRGELRRKFTFLTLMAALLLPEDDFLMLARFFARLLYHWLEPTSGCGSA
jgi:hypothetical protein